jgi:cell division protein FtsW
MARLTAFMDPWADRLGNGWQLANSLLTLGNGGLVGQGLGAGKQKLHYLPEGHTDFIVAVIGEETGLLGILLVVGLFGLLVWRGIRAAFFAADRFGAFLAMGLTALIGIQAVVNMSVAMGLLPTKGLTLPFVSYGGTSLVLSLTAAGVLLAISSGRGGYLIPQRTSRG